MNNSTQAEEKIPNVSCRPTGGQTHITIIPGYGATPGDHWFGWLSERLSRRGIHASIASLPDSLNPKPRAWRSALDKQLGRPVSNSIVIAHSLGCIAALSMLARLEVPWSASALFLVSGFKESLPMLPELDDFLDPDFDADRIIRGFDRRVSVSGTDDKIVPAQYSRRLAEQLNTAIFEVPESTHFLESEGYDSFPLLLSLVNDALSLDPRNGYR